MSVDTLKGLIYPLLILTAIVLIYLAVKLLIDRQRNLKKATNHAWIQIIPKAGKEKNYMMPIEGDVVHIKEGMGKTKPIHILGEPGEYTADWPPGKVKFVQTSVTKITYYEGDAEPLSNISNRPIISAQALANMLDGVATASADAMRKSMEDSGASGLGKSKLLWIYILLITIAVIGVATIIMSIVTNGNIGSLSEMFKTTLGLGQ